MSTKSFKKNKSSFEDLSGWAFFTPYFYLPKLSN
ncbi:hypothetical protein RSSL_01104 [Streptococcus salivarius K12]|uniref:Uncharacterized protein n=1 Tax=Streptococcus salivarius K12 TaxID=1200793 RepID=J7TIE7_STRSL|nr:hypothetical protein RSSL_01104 [Streptococcus salivarius K12]